MRERERPVSLGSTYCVRNVNAALVIDEGRLSPFVISRHSFLLITSTKPPLDTTNLNSSYRSRVCLAIIGILLTGVPGKYDIVKGHSVQTIRRHARNQTVLCVCVCVCVRVCVCVCYNYVHGRVRLYNWTCFVRESA